MARRYHIIAADDDPLYLFVVEQMLATHIPDAAVTAVRSAEEALAVFEERGADLVITDHHMPPGMTGLELLRALRARRVASPVVVVSSDYRIEQEALAAGAEAFIMKGEPLEALAHRLAGLLQPCSPRH